MGANNSALRLFSSVLSISYLILVLPPGLEPGLAAYETTEMTCTSLEADWLA